MQNPTLAQKRNPIGPLNTRHNIDSAINPMRAASIVRVYTGEPVGLRNTPEIRGRNAPRNISPAPLPIVVIMVTKVLSPRGTD
jgi:hypothetical protein